ncbi:MAG: bifunctional ADP-dependent NAD(P)H-hydrate dehydratase/NAD(P)H-hydrate epimerase [Anaerolineae bacterium]|nr:MAG: bifunctional ADP-dependent NAD(P)H-hydrate dehydratase/NAD(P)H-hydrate epimerase [Anaerolineae bacterium]WKZ45480.1 MAG: NAD(P)H-hydrate dehydratase [Anaerolineales bacterium]
MKLVTVSQMQKIEKEADAGGLTYDRMMQNAGHGLAEIIADLFVDDDQLEIVGLIGPGNNGGDALVALTALAEDGWKCRAYLVKRKQDALVKQFTEAGGELIPTEKDDSFFHLSSFIETADVLLDGILGTGIKLPLKKEVAETLSEVNDMLDVLDESPLVVAVDCPSGTDCDTGEIAEEAIHADLTVTMAAVKQGLLKLPAFEYVGDLKVVDIGLPVDLSSFNDLQTEVADEDSIAALLPERRLDSHKGTFGAALIASGSVNYTGAVMLASEAAYRSGAGLVQVAIPASIHAAVAGQVPEATWILLPHSTGVIASDAAEVLVKNLDRATAMLIGPGFGTEDTTREFIENLLAGKSGIKKSSSSIGFVHSAGDEKKDEENRSLPPLVVDADGLRLLSQIKEWQSKLPAVSILTPHPGEMSALTGLPKEEIQEDRQAIASKFAKDWGHVVVLKGAFTVIASPDGKMTVIPVASPALARAGTGDVLAGLIVGLRAQGLDAFDAAVAGAWIHAQAGLYAADDLGATASVLASDVLDSVSDVISDLE